MKTVKEHIIDHLRASAPVSFGSIHRYLKGQYGIIEAYELATILNEMLRHGIIKLYDTGDSFILSGE